MLKNESDDCLEELIRLHNLSDIGQNYELWLKVLAAFNEVTGFNWTIEDLFSRIESLKSDKISKPENRNESEELLKCRIRAEKAREKAEWMTFKAEEARKKRIEVETRVLMLQNGRQ